MSHVVWDGHEHLAANQGITRNFIQSLQTAFAFRLVARHFGQLFPLFPLTFTENYMIPHVSPLALDSRESPGFQKHVSTAGLP